MRCASLLLAALVLPALVLSALVLAPPGARAADPEQPGNTTSALDTSHHPTHTHHHTSAAHDASGKSKPAKAEAQAGHDSGHHATTHPTKHAAETPGARAAGKTAAKAVAKPTPPAATAPAPTAGAPAPPAGPPKGTVTGLPLPRWAALRTDDVNMRRGPGTRYPIEWVYQRRDLPVQIDREFEVWRLVQDADGVKGWVHQATLVGHRSFVITGAEATMRGRPDDAADAIAKLKPGVIGHIRTCDAVSPWCEVQVGDYHGYLRRDAFWGTSPNEAVGG